MDRGHELTEELLKELEKRIAEEYSEAVRDAEKKLKKYMEAFDKEDEIQKERLAAGEITKAEYAEWAVRQKMYSKHWTEMRDALAEDMHHANKIALGIARDAMPDVYALNANYAIYEIEHGVGIDTGMTLYNHDTAAYLLAKERKLMPGPSTAKQKLIAANKDLQWNRQKIQSAVLQGVLLGESSSSIAKRLMSVGQMDYNAAVRYARTMTTNAQNKGRYNSYRRAKAKGVDLTIEWVATLDGRTRHDHRLMHGKRTDVDKPFITPDGFEIMWPAQSDGPGSSDIPQSMIWNCRCTLRAMVKGYERDSVTESAWMRDQGLTFEEWQNEALGEKGRLARIRAVEEEKERVRQTLATAVTVGNPGVNLDYIRSREYGKKFSRATNNSNVNDRLRRLARGSLTTNAGTYTESLYIIDAKTGDRVLYKKGKRNGFEVVLTKSERETVKAHKGSIIAVHNHPTNVHPTGSDFVTAASRKYDFGLVATHDGRVFKYTPPKKKVSAATLDEIIDFHTRLVYTDAEKIEGFSKALDIICERYGATWEELL